MLLWGAAYGLFLGAGIGMVLHLAQKNGRRQEQAAGDRS
jgi:hypothetical protein